MGNHTWSKREIVPYMDDCPWIIRPANYAPQVPGRGWQVVQTAAGDVAVIDLIGRCNMDYGPENPFLMVDKILKQLTAKIILVEIHAEATSEKLAMGYMLDGRVSAVWGTHTHVPTADARVLPKGTGYVTDLGMTGPRDSVLGIRPELSIAKFRGDLPERYRWAEGASRSRPCCSPSIRKPENAARQKGSTNGTENFTQRRLALRLPLRGLRRQPAGASKAGAAEHPRQNLPALPPGKVRSDAPRGRYF